MKGLPVISLQGGAQVVNTGVRLVLGIVRSSKSNVSALCWKCKKLHRCISGLNSFKGLRSFTDESVVQSPLTSFFETANLVILGQFLYWGAFYFSGVNVL